MHEKLGAGGHSDVYRATFRGTDVAIKVLKNHYFNDASSLSRFELEVAIMWYVLYLLFSFLIFFILFYNLCTNVCILAD